MKTTIIPKITIGPIDASYEEFSRLVKAAFPCIGGGVDSLDSVSYTLSIDPIGDQLPRLRAFVDLANHVGLSSSSASAIRAEAETNIDNYIIGLTAIRREILLLEGCSEPKFPEGSKVVHIAGGNSYEIIFGPDRTSVERGCIPSYVYTDGEDIWVSSKDEMEDGSFVLVESL